MTQSQEMGATPHDAGVTFRVWAPFAQKVSVVGDFNDWDAAAGSLQQEDGGRWAADLPGARVGQEYRFQVVGADGRELSRIDPYARNVTNSVGNGIIYDHSAFDWQGDDYACPPIDDLVIYELHVGSFYAEDPQQPGTFAMAYDRLDHLLALGVNAVQIMPVMEFAGDRSWGYNPSHPFAVESIYGGPDALKALVREAHRRGLAVIMDVVYNHFGPSDLDLWQFDGWSENGKGGIYFYNDERANTPWGETRPDYGRPEVRQYIYDNAVSWLRDFHVDGLRWDMTPYVRSVDGGGHELPDGWRLMHDINGKVRAEWPGVVLIAEDMQGKPEITGHAGFHAQWDGAFVHPVRAAMIEMDDANRSMVSVAHAVATRYNDDAFQRVVYTESHDEVANGRARLPEEIDGENPRAWHARKRSMLGAAIALTSPGIPMLFQGQEFLEDEWFRDDVPLEWHLSEEFQGVVRSYADLVRLRRNLGGTTPGLRGQHVGITHLDEQGKVLAYVRSGGGASPGDVLVVVNASHHEHRDYQVGAPAPGRWEMVFNGDARIYSDDFTDVGAGDLHASTGGDAGAHGPVTIAPYTAQVFRLT